MYQTKINADMTNSPSQHLNAVRNVIVFDAAVGEGEVTAVRQTPPLVHQAYHDSATYQRQQREGHDAANRDGTQAATSLASLCLIDGRSKGTGCGMGGWREAALA